MPRYEYKYRRPQRRKSRFGRVIIILLILAVIAYPFFEAFHVTVDEYTTDVKNLPSNLRNLKVVYLSDIHQNSWDSQSRTNKIVKKVNSLSADLVLLGGDYAMDAESAISFFETLPLIQSRLGVYAVLGDYDRSESAADQRKLLDAMAKAGITPLVNEVISIKVGQAYLYIAGIDDIKNGDPDIEGVAAQLSEDDFVILLGHDPDMLPDAEDAVDADGGTHWFDLALFGHTHGGQITLFGKPVLSVFNPKESSRYLSGWFTENRAEILVSNGIGTLYVPMRLFAPAEIHYIKLR
ncbi:MAG TPA: metallophosphoesterase [Candidatus Limiplasma sp.]|nr:metallophosphoesterase [Candidatus Limiplasma sp.]